MKTKSNHTPGPWGATCRGLTGDKHARVVEVWPQVSCQYGDAVCDKNLIQAAPELYAACLSALRALKDNLRPGPMDFDARLALQYAIDRAEGRNLNK